MITIDDILALVRPNIARLTPYRCARDDFDSGILLDANENSFGSVVSSELDLHRYPDPHHTALSSAYASWRGVSPEQLFFGVGSDEAIDNIIRIFCEPGKHEILITPPTYGMYKVSANINNVLVREAPLRSDFQLDVPAVLSAITAQTRIIFLCSPNNPTGNVLRTEDIETLITSFPGIVVLDEAYIDFCHSFSFAKRLEKFPNLVILQTMSKALGLAGIRLGAAIAHPKIVRIMRSIKAPYNLNSFSLQTGLQALENPEKIQRMISEILEERDWLLTQLKQMPSIKQIFPTDANFILIRMDEAKRIYHQIAESGVVIRFRGDQIHCENTLRITVGTREENKKLLALLAQLAAKTTS